METELQEAERFAREFLDSPWALFRTRLLARVFLAQQARLAEVERERDAWKLKAESEGIRIKWRDEERADAERKATELERERDAAIEARDIHNEMLLAAYRNNAEAYAARNAAERKATEAAREQQKAWVAGVRWMCEKFAEAPEVVRAAFTPDKGDIVFYCGERIENVAATLYPAPTEREDAGESLGDLDTLEGVKSWMRSFFNGSDQPSADDLIERFEQVLRRDIAQSPNEVAAAYEAGFAFAKAEYENRTTPPQAAPEPRIAKPSAQVAVGHKMVQRWESDGFGRTWYRVVQKDYPNRDYGDFRAVLHALMSNPPMPTADEYAALLRLAGVPVPEEGGR